jgi:hypothetical protein
MLRRFFADVRVVGLDGSPAVKADFEQRRRAGRRLLALDVLDLRHRLPRRYYVALHAAARRIAYRLMGDQMSGGNSGITADDFAVTETITPATEVLLGVARLPRR